MSRRPAPRRVTDLLFAAIALWAAPAAAQTSNPPGPYVIDVRAAVTSIPADAAFYPAVPSGTIVPSRGFGFDVGGHVYLFKLGPSRVGLGATLLRARGTSSPPVATGSPVTAAATGPDVAATITSVAPQLSLNFGAADGWSYVSAGVGRGRVRASTSAFGTGTTATPAAVVSGQSASSINFGFGARWFTSPRVAFSFDVRFHMVSATPGRGNAAGTPKTTITVGSVGISLK